MADGLHDGTPSYLMSEEPARFGDADWQRLLRHGVAIRASDLYVKSLDWAWGRVDGRLHRISRRIIEAAEAADFLNLVYGSPTGAAELAKRESRGLDGAYLVQVDRRERLRFRWSGAGCLVNGVPGVHVTLRQLPPEPPVLDRAAVGEGLWSGLFPADGIVLVCGETGSGKSTLLAGVVRETATDPEAHCHVLTYEAPIEFTYDRVKTQSCVIDQHEIPRDFPGFADGVRHAMRNDPDVIVIGEMRDPETMTAGFVAAQTGHLVYSTMHTSSVAATFSRPLLAFPAEERAAVCASLVGSIRAVVCQDLIPSADGRRVAIREYLVFTDAMRTELLGLAASDPAAVSPRVAELVRAHGQTRAQHARVLAAAGLISPVVLADVLARFKEAA